MLPDCPTCRSKLKAARLLQSQLQEKASAAGGDATDHFWLVTVSCPGCLAAIELDEYIAGTSGVWSAREAISSTAVLRIRDRLESARASGTLEREVRAVFSNPVSALLLGTPELFEYVSQVFGRSVRLRESVATWPDGSTPEGDFPPSANVLRSVEKTPPTDDDQFVLLEGETLAVIAVRARALLCSHDGHPVLLHPELCDSV